jgi:hypothetical protein
MTPRRFSSPWTVIENTESFWVQDASGQTVGWFSRGGCSCQFGRASAPMIPHLILIGPRVRA